jgi:hypothetical protein
MDLVSSGGLNGDSFPSLATKRPCVRAVQLMSKGVTDRIKTRSSLILVASVGRGAGSPITVPASREFRRELESLTPHWLQRRTQGGTCMELRLCCGDLLGSRQSRSVQVYRTLLIRVALRFQIGAYADFTWR